MPTLIRPATREIRTWAFDSRRWSHYKPRDNDIVIATYPKCGTTWMQRLVGMLLLHSSAPFSIHDQSLWIDIRVRLPIDEVIRQLEAQTDRRFMKAHLPFDALPLYDSVRYIHVARDGRDVCASFHNHALAFTPGVLASFDRIGVEDEQVGRPIPRVPSDFRSYYLDWIANDAATAAPPAMDFFDFERSYWVERARANMLLVHYNDLKADLGGELRRIANFLGIECSDEILAELAEAGSFDAMRRDGDKLLPHAGVTFDGGAARFLFKGTNGRWRDALTADDLALYDAKVAAHFPHDCAHWIEHGRLHQGTPH
ncbi:sulfotransferase domain-containing protein [Roseomonas sp. CAU 1739]|uniref:sulfotransferase domain-containing protein n=1 Tax=Roseomonas sp. CAU 1739 TaxID=3140364 RepID=UPI00325C090F